MFDTPLSKFLGRTILGVGVVALFWLLWHVADTLFLAFAGLLLAMFLRTLTRLLQRVVPLPDQWALNAVVVALLVGFGLVGWLLTPRLNRDLTQLISDIPAAFRNLENQLQQYGWVQDLFEQLP